MAGIYISQSTVKNIIREELDESSSSEFPDYILSETTRMVKDWSTNLDYNKLKRLQKEISKVLKIFEDN